MFEDVVFTSVVVLIGAVVMMALRRYHARDELPVLYLGFLAHVGVVFVQVWIIQDFYGGGDIDGYRRSGMELAAGLREDFSYFAPEMVKLFFHQDDAHLPLELFGGVGGATTSLTVVTGVLFYLLGDSLYAASMAVSMGGFFGTVAIYYAVRGGLLPALRRRLLIAAVLMPSVVFWSGMIAKEAVVLAFLGMVTLLLRPLARGQLKVGQLMLAAVLLSPVVMIKPYVLLAYSGAAAVWIYWESSARKKGTPAIKPFYLVFAAIVAVSGVLAIGRLYPQFAIDTLAQSTATIQLSGSQLEGGSNYQLADGSDGDASLSRQLLVAPIALPTALFRPLIFEVRNPMMFLNALETTLLLVLSLRVLLRGGFRWTRRTILENPTLMFCLTFTVLLGTAVGLASTNMGSLSRYRMPFMPFFVALVFALDGMLAMQRAARRVPVRAPVAPPFGLRKV